MQLTNANNTVGSSYVALCKYVNSNLPDGETRVLYTPEQNKLDYVFNEEKIYRIEVEEDFVKACYILFLFRLPSQHAFNDAIKTISNSSRAEFINGIKKSPEFRRKASLENE